MGDRGMGKPELLVVDRVEARLVSLRRLPDGRTAPGWAGDCLVTIARKAQEGEGAKRAREMQRHATGKALARFRGESRLLLEEWASSAREAARAAGLECAGSGAELKDLGWDLGEGALAGFGVRIEAAYEAKGSAAGFFDALRIDAGEASGWLGRLSAALGAWAEERGLEGALVSARLAGEERFWDWEEASNFGKAEAEAALERLRLSGAGGERMADPGKGRGRRL